MKIRNKIIVSIAAFSVAMMALSSCKKDFFDLTDHNGIDSRIWDDAGAVTQLLDRGYDLIIPQWPTPGSITNTSDELNNANTAFLYGTLTDNQVTEVIGTANGFTTSRYYDIRRCNTAIDGLNEGNLEESVKNPLKGQFFMLRAMVYFNLVRTYGGVPLVLHAQDINDEQLFVPRAKSSVCIAQIVSDLDSAAAFLPKSWAAVDRGRLTKAAALAFKGRVLLTWASPQFNVTNAADRWENAYQACKIAYDTAVSHAYGLYSSYANIFTVEDNAEVMIVRKHDATSVSPGRGTNTEYVTRPRSETTSAAGGGSNQPTWNLVRAYLKSNGMPITAVDNTVSYNDTLFWLNRDPRLAASVSYNGDVWPLSSKAGRKQWNYQGVTDEGSGLTATGFYCKKITNPTISALQTQYNSSTGGGSGMDWVELRFAEVVMNLAEAANETGRLTEAKNMVRLIRQRAGIVAGSYDYGLSIATNMSEMRDLIMNERQVEFAMEGKRFWDLRRTRRLHLLTGTIRQGIRWTPKTPTYTVAFLEANNTLGIKNRDTVTINSINTYKNIFTISFQSLDTSTPINIPTNYYFFPLPNWVMSSSYQIEQTIGWPGGSFDPLQ